MVAQMTGRAKRSLQAMVIGAILFAGSHASAHHAFAHTYLPDKIVTIEGRVVEFLYRNPHSVVLVETPGEKGQLITWAVEWSDAGQLSRQGIEKNTLKPGDHVIITGNPSRKSTDRRMRMQSLTRPSDGWKWSGSF
jgi:hypothetical protein